jgi:hypothetical protein
MEQTAADNCPVSGEKLNETVVRLVAFSVVVIACIAALSHWVLVSLFLALDFSIRAFGSGEYSWLRYLAILLSRFFHLKNKSVDAAPKKFAAALGFAFSLSAAVLQLLHYNAAANVVLGILIFCALLESFLSICLGCMVYGWLQKLSPRK